MEQKVLVFDPEKCIGCRLCEKFCSLGHEGVINPSKSRIRLQRDHLIQKDIAIYCHQCETTPCIEACQFDALTRDSETNAIIVKEEECVACGDCIQVCLYDVPILDSDTDIVIICDLCRGSPECVEICPEQAINFMGLEEAKKLRNKINKRISQKGFKEANKNE
ncbi:MAG: 4Fe-4S dicluster domain-containing protein [Candidatus Lokiarchaeota archaeon]|nr:4Fe-4S dicluster domain-containing protein [Candidatus Lokiarchaeota archaeon]MBD3199972.1 4Fe-4S dicluster domain-containing protein [Candidatus Lokiarchaeota archaeon]